MIKIKLPNGYGSITKLKGNRRNPFWVRKTTGYERGTGKQIYHTVGYYPTRKEALEALADFNKTDPKLFDKSNITLRELYQEWYKQKEQSKITKSTLDVYTTAWIHLSALENMKVKDIKKRELQGVINKLYKDKYSKSSITKVRSMAKQLMDYALGDDLIDKNYAQLVDMPTMVVAQRDVFTDLEIKKIEEFAKVDEWANSILILIYTGLRVGEFIALTKFNIDIDNMLITGGAKTDAGKDRIIPIHPKIQKYFKERYSVGEIINIPGKTLRNKVDNYRRRYYYPALEKVGVRKLSPHCCRHTFGTLSAKAGVDTFSIQKMIGHSDYSTTANIYTRVDIEKLKREMAKI